MELLARQPFLPLLAAINRGVERETLRVTPSAGLAATPHPEYLGSKLCHPTITTDFSEAQLELITPVVTDVPAMLDNLDEIHRYVCSGLTDEYLWSASMPCELPADGEIPLAYYGTSNLGRLKTTYRNGLGYRYGRTMQTICAVHYNFSLPDELWRLLWQESGTHESIEAFRSRRYFELMRNFRRFSWLPVYLFGASPAVADSFARGKPHKLQRLDADSLYSPFATSLRNGDLGYQSAIQSTAIKICYNSLDNYVDTLVDAVITPYPEYTRIGTVSGEEYRQVNNSMLQSEAEFYTTVRAKRMPPPGVNFLRELKTKGVEYLEVRLLDVNPYLPLGIGSEQIRFLDTMLLYCLLLESPEHDDPLCRSAQENVAKVVYRGRDSNLQLDDQGVAQSIMDWGTRLLEAMQPVAELLDRTTNIDEHGRGLAGQLEKIRQPEATLSARMLDDMQAAGQSFVEFAQQKTMEHQQYFMSRPLPDEITASYRKLAATSRIEQQKIEQADTVSFDRYLEQMMQGYKKLADER